MPPALRQHIRYPEDLFKIQADRFLTFHMQDPRFKGRWTLCFGYQRRRCFVR